eukprot:3844217-Amphidinium_carterae.3
MAETSELCSADSAGPDGPLVPVCFSSVATPRGHGFPCPPWPESAYLPKSLARSHSSAQDLYCESAVCALPGAMLPLPLPSDLHAGTQTYTTASTHHASQPPPQLDAP